MAWDFSTEPEFQEKLDWMREFVRAEIWPLETIVGELDQAALDRIYAPLQRRVKEQGLWAAHLEPELGGQGFGQLKLGLMHEILGTSPFAPGAFGCQAPDSGNSEILALAGTPEQKDRWLHPLLAGDLRSAFSMTEPDTPGSDPTQLRTRATRDGEDWVIDGHKWFSSNGSIADFLIVMAVTNPDVSPYKGMSMFLVPTDTPGVIIERNIGLLGEPLGEGMHALIHYDDARVPSDALLGGEGQAFVIAQTRLGGGRVHHAMRTVGSCSRAFDMMCERVLSRETQGSLLAEKQSVQNYIADSYAQIEQFRLFVLYTAWLIDQNTTAGTRKEIAAVKVLTAQVLHDVVYRAMHVHGALGVSNEMPFGGLWMQVPVMGIVDGPTEVHKATVARQVLKDYRPAPGLWPTQHLPGRIEAAKAKFAEQLETEVGNL